MLTLTDAARERVRAFMADGFIDQPALRIALVEGSSPLAPDYEFSLVEASEQTDDDLVIDAGGITILMDLRSAASMDGAVVDFAERDGESGFVVRSSRAAAPRSTPVSATPDEAALAARIEEVLEERINPAIAAHGGRITLVSVEGTVANVEMSGGCQGCGMARVTLRQGVERMLREAIPEISEVRDVTDHLAGTNPYFR